MAGGASRGTPSDHGSGDHGDGDHGSGDHVGREHRIHALNRIGGFTDAVVAIALTLLVLPLVEVARQYPPTASLGALLSDNAGTIVGFVVSFLVILRFWAIQRRMFESLIDFDEALVALATLWLLGVVFLPFPTAWLFVEAHLRTDATLFYLGVMAFTSVLGLAQAAYVLRRPALRRPGTAGLVRQRFRNGVAACLVFGIAAVVALFAPAFGLLTLVLLGGVRRFGGLTAARDGAGGG